MSVVTQHLRPSKTPLFPFTEKNPKKMVFRCYEEIYEVCTSPAFSEGTYFKTYAPLLGRRVFVPDTAEENLGNKFNKESVEK